MDKEFQFAKTQEKLVGKIQKIVKEENNPEYVRNAFRSWLKWFAFLNTQIKKNVFKDLPEESNLFYRAFVIPKQEFYAIQIWEKHQTLPLVRCVKTLYANKLDETNWAENDVVPENRKRA